MNNVRQLMSLPSQVSTPSADIVVVGLGPGPLQDLTLAAWRALSSTPRILLKTSRHPCATQLADILPVIPCDDLYQQHGETAEAIEAVVQKALALGKEPGGVVYAVPGHPLADDSTVRPIMEAAESAGLTVSVIGGMSVAPTSLVGAGVEMTAGAQVIDAANLARDYHPPTSVSLPLLITHLRNKRLAERVQKTLTNAYPEIHEIVVFYAGGGKSATTPRLPLRDLGRLEIYDHMTTLYVPPLQPGSSFTDLQEIVAHLRAPDGCPWDRKQTLETLRQDLLSECVEVLEAIDLETDGSDNSDHIAEEIGDLMMVATMMVQIAIDGGRFRMADVMRHIVTKLIRRHPHIFGDVSVDGADDVIANWDAIKAQERAAKGQPQPSPLDDVPAHLPALEKARKIQSRAAKAGLLDRARLARSMPELSGLLGPEPDETAIGRLLWVVTALAHEQGVNAEDALRAYTVGYRQRLAVQSAQT